MAATQLHEEVESTTDDWITGSDRIETTEVTFTSGGNLAAREAVAINTSTGKAVTYAEAGANGTNVAVYLTAYAVDATAGETQAQVYKAGSFNPELVVWSGTPTQAQKDSAFVGTPISLQSPQA